MALERADIVAAALDLLDEVGIEGLTTRRLAARLGVKGPSLYWHFRSVRELYDQMAEAMLEEVLPSPDPAQFPGDWAQWLAAGARGIRNTALKRRDGARILAGARPTGQSEKISMAAMVGRLRAEGFSPDDARATIMALGRYAMGWALGEQVAHGPTAASAADFEFGLQSMLDGIARRLPQVRARAG